MASKERFLYLEPLRGIFAIGIVIVHGGVIGSSSFFLANDKLIENGIMLIDLFFQLSGFVIAYSYADRITGSASAAVFQFNRFLRVYPLHIITFLCFAIGFPLAEYAKEVMTGRVGGEHAFIDFNFSAFLNNIFLTQGVVEKHLTYNYPSWSVSVEFYTYIVFAIVFAMFSTKMSRILASVILVVFSAWILHMTNSVYPETRMALFRCIYSFFLGVLLYYIYTNFRVKVPSVFVYLSFALLIASIYFSQYLSSLITPFTYSFIFLSLLWSGNSIIKRLLCSPKLVFLGTISYGIYMIHALVWYVISRTMIVVFGYKKEIEPMYGDTILIIDPLLSTILLVFGTCISVLLAYLSYRYIEMPLNKKRMKMPVEARKEIAAGTYVHGYSNSH